MRGVPHCRCFRIQTIFARSKASASELRPGATSRWSSPGSVVSHSIGSTYPGARRAKPTSCPKGTAREHRQQSDELTAIARSGLENLFRQAAGKNYVLLLSDLKA